MKKKFYLLILALSVICSSCSVSLQKHQNYMKFGNGEPNKKPMVVKKHRAEPGNCAKVFH